MVLKYYGVFIRLLLICIFSISFQCIDAQVFISEVGTNNGSTIEDENEDEPDWIELYNSGTSPVNLDHYFFTDSNNEPWLFPPVNIQPLEYLIIFASGKNRYTPVLHTSFELSKNGETLKLFNSSGTLIDELSIPYLQLDHSYGRKPDLISGVAGIFNLPTPGVSNQNSNQYSGYAADPEFSLPAGFYNGLCVLELNSGTNTAVHFTLDGNTPTDATDIYILPLTIGTTTAVTARTFSNDISILPSEIVSNTYLLNYNTSLPVFSISTNPANFWDWNTGIYVTGPNASPAYPYYGANYWQDWEIPANIEFFETNKKRIFSQVSGVSIHGGSQNRTRAMKSLRLTSKSKFGKDEFHHQFFEEKEIDKFKVIVLRNSSGDFNKTHFRDGSLHKLMIGNINIDLNCYRPSAVFINGIYYGVHNIRERISKYYLEENYGIDGGNVDLLEEDSLVLEGDFTAFNSMYGFVTGNNMADEGKFNTASGMIDTESLCDYYIAETFLSNIDWPYNNIKFWKVREPDTKWRYILIDLDIALGNNGWAPASFDVLGRIMGPYGDNNRHVQIFRSMLGNAQFREYFINRYADLVNTLFSAENMTRHITEVRETLVDEMPAHFTVWGNNMQGWDNEIYNVVMPHIADRPAFALEQVQNTFALTSIVELELEVWPKDAGTITINTITPGPLPWKGNYFNGNPVTIQVHANPGYTFVRWDSDNLFMADPNNEAFRINPELNNRFTAWFGTSDDPEQLMVYPNPASESVQIGCILDHETQGKIEIFDAKGQKVPGSNAINLQKGVNKLDFSVRELSAGIYHLHLVTDVEVKVARLVVM